MTKTNLKKDKRKIDPPVSQANALLHDQSLVNRSNLIPFVLICLFMAVDFIPDMGAADVLGSQWVFLGIVNLLSIIFIAGSRNNNTAIAMISAKTLSLLLIALLFVMGLSISVALNKTESVVCYARFMITAIMYFNIAVLLYGRLDLFKLFARVLTIFLLIQSLDVLNRFFSGLGNTELSELIYNLRGNAGNKNILAASLVIKLPFAMYGIYISKIFWKSFGILILALSVFAIFIINARSAYVAIILEILLYIVFCIIEHFRSPNRSQTAYRISFIIFPVLVSFILSNMVLRNAIGSSDAQTTFGTVTERLNSISLTEEGTDARSFFWSNALDYTKKNLWLGSGYGNWKLASIPYERKFYTDYSVSYHVHNDFLEMTAETGIVGGLLYLSLFICVAVYLLRSVLRKTGGMPGKSAAFISMAVAGYFIDAFLNFPLERPVMQFFFAFLLAFGLNVFSASKAGIELPGKMQNSSINKWYSLFIALFLIPAMTINFLGYRSLVAQKRFNDDMQLALPREKWQDVNSAFPSIPNLNVSCYPVDAIKARYLMKEKKYDEALAILNRSARVNPYLTLNEHLKGETFLVTYRLDSAFYFAKKAFNSKPKVSSNYILLNYVCVELHDTATIENAFHEIVSIRNDEWVWNEYLSTLINLKTDKQRLLSVADSALRIFPNDIDLIRKKAAIQNMQAQQ